MGGVGPKLNMESMNSNRPREMRHEAHTLTSGVRSAEGIEQAVRRCGKTRAPSRRRLLAQRHERSPGIGVWAEVVEVIVDNCLEH